jgi:hypothetical protein
MEMDGQLIPLLLCLQHPLDGRLGRLCSWSGHMEKSKTCCSCWKSNPNSSAAQPAAQSTYQLRYLGPSTILIFSICEKSKTQIILNRTWILWLKWCSERNYYMVLFFFTLKQWLNKPFINFLDSLIQGYGEALPLCHNCPHKIIFLQYNAQNKILEYYDAVPVRESNSSITNSIHGLCIRKTEMYLSVACHRKGFQCL